MRLLADDEPRVWSFPACEPGLAQRCRLNVTRWWKRVPSRTKPITVPAGLKLAILTRGRTRLPFQSIRWLIDLGRATRHPLNAWARRLPANPQLVTLLAEVDVTVELFVVLPRMRTSTVNYVLGQYLRQRHATEIANCSSRFLYTWDSVSSKAALENRLSEGCPSRLSLSPLIPTGMKAPATMDPVELASFIFLVYASFPNDIDLHLAPRPAVGGTPRERVFGHLYRVYDEFTPLDEEDDEVFCLVDRLLDNANDEYTTRHMAEAYADGQLRGFKGHLKKALDARIIAWRGTNTTRFLSVLRDLNRKAQTGLSMIDLLANDDVTHEWPAVREMWAWRNQKLRDPRSVMYCFKGKIRA